MRRIPEQPTDEEMAVSGEPLNLAKGEYIINNKFKAGAIRSLLKIFYLDVFKMLLLQTWNEQSNCWKSFKKVICRHTGFFVEIDLILDFFFRIAGEVPVTKLAALQKVLQSDFLASVREVYEHVYETVDIQGSQVRNVLLSCSIG